MSDDRRITTESEPLYSGMRLTSDEYLALPDDGFRYELIDGVVVMSPTPKPDHQDAVAAIEFQIRLFLREHPIGRLYEDIDVRFDAQTLYAPDLLFIAAGRLPRRPTRIDVVPDLIVEVISPSSERRDLTTKMADYQRCGVKEYWVIDAARHSMRFFRLQRGKLTAVRVSGTRFRSRAIPGFVLNLAELKRELNWA
jgi:Uma2 family endonuclease